MRYFFITIASVLLSESATMAQTESGRVATPRHLKAGKDDVTGRVVDFEIPKVGLVPRSVPTFEPVPVPGDTSAPATAAPVVPPPVTPAPITSAPITSAPITSAPITSAPITSAPVTAAPVTDAVVGGSGRTGVEVPTVTYDSSLVSVDGMISKYDMDLVSGVDESSAGSLYGACIDVGTAASCTMDFAIDDHGSIMAIGTMVGDDSVVTMAVVGGTGGYKGVTGTVTIAAIEGTTAVMVGFAITM